MIARGAILREVPGRWEVVDIQLTEPQQDELLVRMVATGLCHSDDHNAAGDLPPHHLPMAGGHEGAGIVEAVGPNTVGWEVGDHLVTSFMPACGRCRMCATGHQNLCDAGSEVLRGFRSDGSARMFVDGEPVGQIAGLSTFSAHTVMSVRSAVKIDPSLPLETVCVAGCGVGTGWGSAVNSADVRPGDTVIVMGVGGVGINAVQGAAYAGATNLIAVDPVAFKREQAVAFGATHAVETIAEAGDLARSMTNGQGADSAIISVGLLDGQHVADAFVAIRKGGTVVVTAVANHQTTGIPIPLVELVMWQKRIQGSLFGESNPQYDIPLQLAMYRAGKLRLDELVTTRYRLDDINQGFADMHEGRNLRGVIVHEH